MGVGPTDHKLRLLGRRGPGPFVRYQTLALRRKHASRCPQCRPAKALRLSRLMERRETAHLMTWTTPAAEDDQGTPAHLRRSHTQQAVLALHRVRSLLVRQRTA